MVSYAYQETVCHANRRRKVVKLAVRVCVVANFTWNYNMTTDKANYTFLRVRRKGLHTTRGSARARNTPHRIQFERALTTETKNTHLSVAIVMPVKNVWSLWETCTRNETRIKRTLTCELRSLGSLFSMSGPLSSDILWLLQSERTEKGLARAVGSVRWRHVTQLGCVCGRQQRCCWCCIRLLTTTLTTVAVSPAKAANRPSRQAGSCCSGSRSIFWHRRQSLTPGPVTLGNRWSK